MPLPLPNPPPHTHTHHHHHHHRTAPHRTPQEFLDCYSTTLEAETAGAERSPASLCYTSYLLATVHELAFYEGLAAVLPCFMVGSAGGGGEAGGRTGGGVQPGECSFPLSQHYLTYQRPALPCPALP